ncbi:hypothetical protein DPMN_172220 [Dreissena polymorpha]|uniref:Uncharacterized protein n=1 Tax=Dreissena polymorpha TaxID=45954 RepID=A0A9D4E1W2_DREPO|nr:hypothetical protein DPMN_172220 [Dreissena polymorpha]
MSQNYVWNPMPRSYVWRPMSSRRCMETYDLETMYGNLCLRVYVWRPMSRSYVWTPMTSRLCMETYVSEHFVMTPSLCDSLP